MNDADVKAIAGTGKLILDNIERVIVGKSALIELVLVCIFCEGHILLVHGGIDIIENDITDPDRIELYMRYHSNPVSRLCPSEFPLARVDAKPARIAGAQ